MMIIDGNNVMGAGADGWWNDPPAAARRLTQRIAEWCRTHDDDVVIVFDGLEQATTRQLSGGNLSVRFSGSRKRDGADDVIVELVEDLYSERPEMRVVTSDRGLIGRLPPGVEIEGSGGFRRRLGLEGGQGRSVSSRV